MTEKQKRFCDEYLIDLNATQAAIRAGYSKKTAYSIGEENLKKPEILEHIKKRMDEKDKQLIASQDEVLKYLTAVMRREKTEFVVVTVKEKKSYYDDNGKKITEDKETPQAIEIPARLCDANKAAELLGKRYGLFRDNVSVSGIAAITIIDDMGDEDE